MNSLERWNGSLVKLYVSCHTEQHCVLLKLQSLSQKYSSEVSLLHCKFKKLPFKLVVVKLCVIFQVPRISPTRTPKYTDNDDTTHTYTYTDFSGGGKYADYSLSGTAAEFTSKHTKKWEKTSSVTSTTGNSNHGQSEKSSGEEHSTVVPVIVTITLLLVALALAIGFLAYYRRRKR